MKQITGVTIIVFSFLTTLQATAGNVIDSLKAVFEKQLFMYPQEKIHVHNDKPCYMAGETIWFSAYVADASSHLLISPSRYVYGELIDPLDSAVYRVRIRPEQGKFHGFMNIPEDLPEGDYQLRFYTRYMMNLGEDYFFRKKVRIGTPLSASHRAEATFTLDERGNKITAKLLFTETESGNAIKPRTIAVTDGAGNVKSINPNNTVATFPFRPPANGKNDVLCVEYEYADKVHKQYIPVLPADADFDVAFLPEGGNLIAGEFNSVAFKALNANGLSEPITGIVCDERGDSLCDFKSNHLGMGVIFTRPGKGGKYHALCKNNRNIEKRFELPVAESAKVSLHTIWRKNKLYVSPVKSPDNPIPDSLLLIIQSGGMPLHIDYWDKTKEYMIFNSSSFPCGVIHILLADSNLNPLSERLVFNMNNEEIADISFSTEQPAYGKRELINSTISVTDRKGDPLKAYLSVAVTDDNDVQPDSCVSILSTMLLTSELKGHIETPTWYFSGANKSRAEDLDILMMTQGWSRYNVTNILKGILESPKHGGEITQQITGSVKGGFFLNRSSAGYPVSLLSTTRGFFYDEVETDEQGHFIFSNFEAPDSTKFIIQGKNKKGNANVELNIVRETYAPVNRGIPPVPAETRESFEQFIEKATQKYSLENMKTITLEEIRVTAARNEKKVSKFYSSSFGTVISNETIQRMNPTDIYALLQTVGGVMVSGKDIYIRGASQHPLIIVDDVESEYEFLDNIFIADVEAIEVLKGPEAAIFGSRGGNGVIMIKTKTGESFTARPKENFNIKLITPLGFQVTREFYSPKYEPGEKKDTTPDLRTTIYWNPDVRTSPEGKANIGFYSADSRGNYSVVIEGITHNGKLVHSVEKISFTD